MTIAQTGVKTLLFGLHLNLAVKKLQQKAIVFVFLLISGQNSLQVATAFRMRQVRLLKCPSMRYFTFQILKIAKL